MIGVQENLFKVDEKSTFDHTNVIIMDDWYSVEKCNFSPYSLFIFGDNNMRVGSAGQAQIRSCQNATGLSTKKIPSMEPGSFFSDLEYDACCAVIYQDITKIKLRFQKGGYTKLIFPRDGLGTGLSQLPTKAPRVYEFLNKMLLAEFGIKTNIPDGKLYIGEGR